MANGDLVRFRQGSRADVVSTAKQAGQLLFATYEDEVMTTQGAESFVQGDIYFDLSDGPSGIRVNLANDVDKARTLFAGQTSTSDTAGQWTATIDGITKLYDGLTIVLRLNTSYNSTFNSLNVNGLGAKLVWYRKNSRLTSHVPNGAEILLVYRTAAGSYTVPSTSTRADIAANTVCTDGWILATSYADGNTIPSAYCSTGASTTAKTASCSGYAATANHYIHIIFSNTNTANVPTLNINSTGAKPIYLNGQPVSSSNKNIVKGSYIAYYDGTAYYLRNDGILPGRIENAILADTASALANGVNIIVGSIDSNDHLPNATNTYNLGSSSKIWKQLYVKDIAASGEIQGNTLDILDNASIGGNLTVNGTINATINGNATTATGFASAKTIALTGDVTGSASGGDGSNGWSIATTIGAGKVTNTMLAGGITNSKLASSDITIAGNPVSLGSALPASTLLNSLGLSSAMHFIGTTTSTLSDGATTSPIVVGGSNHTPTAGDVVIYDNNEYVWTSGNTWELLGQDGSFKVVQTAYNSNTITSASTNTSLVISDIFQDAQGVISVTKKRAIVPNTFTIKVNNSSSNNQGLWEFDGSVEKIINFVAGTGISITSDNLNTINIANTVSDTHYTANMILSSAANSTTPLNASANYSGPYLSLIENDTVRKSIRINGSGDTTVTGNANAVTITSVDQKVKQNPVTNTTNSNYRLLLSSITADSQAVNTSEAYRSDQLKYNPSTNTLTVGTVSGSLSGNATTATSAGKVNNSLTLKVDGGSTDQKDSWVFDGSAGKTINFKSGAGILLKTATNGNYVEVQNLRVPFVAGTQTAQTGSWTGTSNEIDTLYDGLTIAYWLPYPGSGNATLNLNLANGTSTGAKNCYYSGASRLTTHFGAGSVIFLTYRSAGNVNGTNYEGWWANANYDSNNLNALRWDNSTITAGANNKIYPYTIIMMTSSGCYESIVTSSSTGTSKAKDTTGFVPGRMAIMWYNTTIDSNNKLTASNYAIYEAYTGLDGRYSFNINTTQWDTGKPLYLVGTIDEATGLFYIADNPWWSQTLPVTDDGKVYMYVGSVYMPASTTKDYRFNLAPYHPMYAYKDGSLRDISTYATGAGKVIHALTITGNGSTTANSGKWVFDGSADKSINIKAGTGISITNASNEITIANTVSNTHYEANMYLASNATNQSDISQETLSPYINFAENSTLRKSIKFEGAGYTDVKGSADASKIVITSTDQRVQQTNNTSTNDSLRVLLSSAANDTEVFDKVYKNSSLTYNPSTKKLSTYDLETSHVFNYSGIETGTSAGDRPVWYSYLGVNGRPVINANQFKYNPGTNTLTVGTVSGDLSGNAATATAAGKVNNSLIIKIPHTGNDTENTNTWTFDGSDMKRIDIAAGSGISITPSTYGFTITSTAVGTDDKVKQTNTTSNSDYRVLLSYGANDNEETNQAYKSSYLKFNPNTKTLTADHFNGIAKKLGSSFTVKIPHTGNDVEDTNIWTFDGENDKRIDIAAGSGISITESTYGFTIANTAMDSHYTTAMYLGSNSTASTNNASTTSNPYLMILDNSTVRNRIQLKGSGATTVTGTASSNNPTGTVTISSTDENVEQLLDNSGNVNYRLLLSSAASTSSLVGGSHFSTNLTFNPSTGLLSGQNLSLTGTLSVGQGSTFTGAITANGGLTVTDLTVTGDADFAVIPTAPTAVAGTNNTSLATTAFVNSAMQSAIFANGSPLKTARYDALGTVLEAALHHDCLDYVYKITDAEAGGQSPAFQLSGKTHSISLLIGSGNENRGIYSHDSAWANWLLYWDTDRYALLNSGKFGVNGKNNSYNFYVNGSSFFNGNILNTGNTTHNGIVYFANGTTYYINNSAQGYLANLSLGTSGTNTSYKLYVAGESYFNGSAIAKGFYHWNANGVQDGSWTTGTTGTTSAVGTNILTLGNATASGSTNNSKGYFRIYGASTGYGELTYNDSMFQSTKSIYLSNTVNSGISNEIRGLTAATDYWRIAGGATASDSGYLEIASSGDANEPIYIRQYSGTFGTLSRTLTLLDASGNSQFPGYINRTFTASNQEPMLWMNGADYDNYLFQISGGTNSKQYYGYGLKYIGTGSGAANYLQLLADNQNGTDIIALCVNQSGQIGLGANASTDARLYVDGNSSFKGDLLPQATDTYSLGDAFLRWKTLYVESFNPDYTYKNSATVTVKPSEWTNILAGNTTGLTDGTYIIQLKITSTTNTAYYSGVCSWIQATSSAVNVYSEIPLHAVQKGLANEFYLRTAMDGNGIYLQISQSSSTNTSLSANAMTILFKKIM